MKTRLLPISVLLLAKSATLGADTTPAPSAVSWNQNFSLTPFGSGSPTVANPGTSTTGNPPIVVPTGTGYPVTDIAAVKALLDVRAALKDSYTLLYNLSDKYGQGTARSEAKENKGAVTSLPDDIGQIVKALAGDEGMAQALQNISNVLGDPSKAPVDPTRNWTEMNDLKEFVQDWLSEREPGGTADSPTPAYDQNLTNPATPDDGKQALSDAGPLTPKQMIENWLAIIKRQPLPHPPPTGSKGATAGGLFEAITASYKVEKEQDPADPTADPGTEDVARDPKLYVSAVNQLAAVKSYYQIRESALTRRKDLQQLLSDILVSIRDAKDFASLGKLTSLANLIEGQIDICNDDINGAFNDVAVRGVQMFTMSQMQQTAAQEKQQYEMNKKLSQAQKVTDDISTIAGGSGSTTGGGSTATISGGGFLPWPIRR